MLALPIALERGFFEKHGPRRDHCAALSATGVDALNALQAGESRDRAGRRAMIGAVLRGMDLARSSAITAGNATKARLGRRRWRSFDGKDCRDRQGES
jgi:hypothetical protein